MMMFVLIVRTWSSPVAWKQTHSNIKFISGVARKRIIKWNPTRPYPGVKSYAGSNVSGSILNLQGVTLQKIIENHMTINTNIFSYDCAGNRHGAMAQLHSCTCPLRRFQMGLDVAAQGLTPKGDLIDAGDLRQETGGPGGPFDQWILGYIWLHIADAPWCWYIYLQNWVIFGAHVDNLGICTWSPEMCFIIFIDFPTKSIST